jgi:FkbM family methyltransferase
MLTAVKSAGKRFFGAFGLEIRKAPAPGTRLPNEVARASMRGALRQLSSLGFVPRTVIDVGVAYETAELYQEFPKADILLIEPLVEFELFLKKICGTYNAQYVLAAAGAGVGTASLNVHADRFGSSLLKEVEGAAVDGTPRQVPVVTIDGVCAEKKLGGPYLIKVDVQGAELLVLAGARRTLEETEAVVLETTLFGTIVGGPQLYDVIVKMKEYGFVVYDICGFTYRPLDQALLQADIVFVREQGRFRESHVFATPEQRRAQLCRAEETHRKLTAGSGEKEKLG